MKKTLLRKALREEIQRILEGKSLMYAKDEKDFTGGNINKIKAEANKFKESLKAERMNVMQEEWCLYFPDFKWQDGKKVFGPSIGFRVGSDNIYIKPMGKTNIIKVSDGLLERLIRSEKIEAYSFGV